MRPGDDLVAGAGCVSLLSSVVISTSARRGAISLPRNDTAALASGVSTRPAGSAQAVPASAGTGSGIAPEWTGTVTAMMASFGQALRHASHWVQASSSITAL